MKHKLTFKQSITAGLSAVLFSVIINLLLFFLFKGAGLFTDSINIEPGKPLTFVHIIISSTIPTLLASIVFFLFEKFTDRGYSIFRTVSLVLLIFSFINPFMGIPGVTVGYALALNVMHVVVAAAVLYFINRAIKAHSIL